MQRFRYEWVSSGNVGYPTRPLVASPLMGFDVVSLRCQSTIPALVSIGGVQNPCSVVGLEPLLFCLALLVGACLCTTPLTPRRRTPLHGPTASNPLSPNSTQPAVCCSLTTWNTVYECMGLHEDSTSGARQGYRGDPAVREPCLLSPSPLLAGSESVTVSEGFA